MENLKSNWKTTVLGICAGLPTLVMGIITHDFVMIAKGISLIGMGMCAKDA